MIWEWLFLCGTFILAMFVLFRKPRLRITEEMVVMGKEIDEWLQSEKEVEAEKR